MEIEFGGKVVGAIFIITVGLTLVAFRLIRALEDLIPVILEHV